MKTSIITTDTYLNHDTGQGHPERPDRVKTIIDHFRKVSPKNLIWEKPKKFDLKYLEFAHDKNYLDSVKNSFLPTLFTILFKSVDILPTPQLVLGLT